jgi:hypothetical protein
MEYRRACLACEHPANADSERCTECGEAVPLAMVSLRGAESARGLSTSRLLLSVVVQGALTIVCLFAFLSGIERTGSLSHRLNWIETFGLFALGTFVPVAYGLGFGYRTWQSLTTLLGRGALRTEVRVIVTPEGVWCSSDDPAYPKARRPWSKIDALRADAKGRLLRIRRDRPLKPLDLLWQMHESEGAAESEANRLNAIFAALQAAAPPKKDDEDATESEESTPSSRDR